MDNDKLEQDSDANRAESASECGPGCNCGKTGISKKGKMVICLVIAIAAVVVLANSVMQKTETGVDQGQNAFATKVTAAEKASTPLTEGKANKTDQAKPSLWGEPLESLASLDEVAAQKDAVYVYLPTKGQGLSESVKKNIEVAAGKAQSRGTTMALYTLDDGSKDYALLANQTSTPCVLAMVKGSGMNIVSGNISEANLLQALVVASRPSGCSPGSSCGPSGCAVQPTRPPQI
jgi:hypothetical protein